MWRFSRQGIIELVKDYGHIGADGIYHCQNCGHHHCVKCGQCHRCGCNQYVRNSGEAKSKRFQKKYGLK